MSEDFDKNKKTIDHSYVGSKIKLIEVSPILNGMKNSKIKSKAELGNTVYKHNKDISPIKQIEIKNNDKIDNPTAKSIKGIPIKFFNETIIGKSIPSNPNSDRLAATKSSRLKSNFLKK